MRGKRRINESNVLILQSDRELKDLELSSLYENILKQKESGVILLPNYVKVVNVPEEEINGELVVMNSGAPEPEKYVIKRVSGIKGFSYVLNVRPSYECTLLVDFTEYKMAALRFSETEANELLKKLGNGYEMEEL